MPYINHSEITKIDLDGNKIKVLYSPIIAPKLSYLHISMNDIEVVQIPLSSKLPLLKTVDFRGNLITYINDEVLF
jgi:Leucine-rich repeat (LRR) protein